MISETIAAIASPEGAALSAVIRISGPETFTAINELFPNLDLTNQRFPCVKTTSLTLQTSEVDWPKTEVQLYLFKAPRSYTTEDMAELHCLGAPAFLSAILQKLKHIGIRQAQAGEFTRRAFIHGRIDLTQAEAVLALTNLERAHDVKLAARSLSGELGNRIDQTKVRLTELAAFVEAGIDFSEEEIDLLPVSKGIELLENAKNALLDLKLSCAKWRWTRFDAVIALAGKANAGKSTLFNALAGTRRAITSNTAGTTRDVLETITTIGSQQVRLLDLAGDKEALDTIEQQALQKAKSAKENADLILHVVDASSPDAKSLLNAKSSPAIIKVFNKRDQLTADAAAVFPQDSLISANSGEGLDALKAKINQHLEKSLNRPGLEYTATTRQLGLLDSAIEALEQAKITMETCGDERWELSMVDIWEALDNLGEITGAVATDDVLDVIFGKFCIGK